MTENSPFVCFIYANHAKFSSSAILGNAVELVTYDLRTPYTFGLALEAANCKPPKKKML